jgi:hypothetical protein
MIWTVMKRINWTWYYMNWIMQDTDSERPAEAAFKRQQAAIIHTCQKQPYALISAESWLNQQ